MKRSFRDRDLSPIRDQGSGGNAAFSLLELLLVLSLMLVMLAVVGMTASGSGQSAALRSAQALFAHEAGRVRALANVRQTRARLLVSANAADHARYLREIKLAYEWPLDSGQWLTDLSANFLPSSVAVIPTFVPPDGVVDGLTWPSGASAPLSHLIGPVGFSLNGFEDQEYYYFEIASVGNLNPPNAQVAVATVRNFAANKFRFDNAAAVRGVSVQANGAVRLIDDARDF